MCLGMEGKTRIIDGDGYTNIYAELLGIHRMSCNDLMTLWDLL